MRERGHAGGRDLYRAEAETLPEALPGLPAQSVLEFIGTNERSLRRRRASATANSVARLTCKESDRLWRLAESLAEAALVLGDVKSAEVWMTRPQLGLSVQRPVELLATSPGAQLVKAFLLRLEYGVYV